MSHPSNKRERFFIGDNKAKCRFYGQTRSWITPKEWSKEEERIWNKKGVALRRKTTKLCSCSMCGNPRRNRKEIDNTRKKKFKKYII